MLAATLIKEKNIRIYACKFSEIKFKNDNIYKHFLIYLPLEEVQEEDLEA